MIWEFGDIELCVGPSAINKRTFIRSDGKGLVADYQASTCPYCQEPLATYEKEWRGALDMPGGVLGVDVRRAETCDICGWWRVAERMAAAASMGGAMIWEHIGHTILKQLDLLDLSTPVTEVAEYLRHRYDTRHSIDPSLWERVVASVFAGLGYDAIVTGHSGDGGIDVILHDGTDTIGVQVKRSRNSIRVEQIRALVGALVQAGLTRGAFVTTNRFQSGAYPAADAFAQAGYVLELYDADRFFSALDLNRRDVLRSIEDFEAYGIYHRLLGTDYDEDNEDDDGLGTLILRARRKSD